MINEGDKVSRQINIGEPERRYGIIIKRYRARQGYVTTPMTLFDIKWDDGEIGQAYFEVSLQKEK